MCFCATRSGHNLLIIIIIVIIIIIIIIIVIIFIIIIITKDVCHNLWRAQTALIHYTRGPAE